jgi:predicted HicB family RNase H-like nuclease
MTSTLSYDGYVAKVVVDVEAGILHGEVLNTRDVLTFSVKSVDDLQSAFIETIQDYKEWCEAEGVQPQKPLSGTMTLRMSPELHVAVANRAASLGLSLNAWIVSALECQVGRRLQALTVPEVDQRVTTIVNAEVVRVLKSRTLVGQDPELPAWTNQDSSKQRWMQ